MPSGWMKGVDIITNLSSMGNRPRPMHVMPIPGKIDMESKPRTMVVVMCSCLGFRIPDTDFSLLFSWCMYIILYVLFSSDTIK